MKILAWETATDQPSVALRVDGALLQRALPSGAQASEQLLESLKGLLAEAGLKFAQLDMLAVGRGPGSFTGVRLAISVAQGLGYSTGLPVTPVSTLRAVACDVLVRRAAGSLDAASALPGESRQILVLQDARMGEIYAGCFPLHTSGRQPLAATEELVTADALLHCGPWLAAARGGAWVGGSALIAFAAVRAAVVQARYSVVDGACASAGAVAELAECDGLAAAVAPAALLPVYLRNQVAMPPANA